MDTEALALLCFLAGPLVLLLLLAWCATMLLGPGVLYLTHKIEARPTLVPTPVSEFPVEVRRYVAASVEALESRGFHVTSALSAPRCVPGLHAYAVTLLHAEMLDQAIVTAIFSRGAKGQLKAKYVEFNTRCASGISVETLNSPLLGSFVHGPEAVKASLPEEKDLRLLYQMHRHICMGCALGGVAIGPEEEDGAAHLQRVTIEACREQERRGLLCLDDAGPVAVFRLTYKGACWMCWSQQWPLASVRRARAADAAMRRLSGFRGDVTRAYRARAWGVAGDGSE